MTEINPNIDKISTPGSGVKKNTSDPKGSKGFDQVLSDQMETKSPGQVEPLKDSSLPEIGGVYKPSLGSNGFNAAIFTDKINTSLDQLDTYSSWLADPGKS